MVVCSPFRRCLQTAGQVCRTLGLTSLTVDMGLSEDIPAVHECIPPADAASVQFTLLTPDEMRTAVGPGVTITNADALDGPVLDLAEDLAGSAARVRATFDRLCAAHPDHNVLCVSHWYGVEQLGLYVEPARPIAFVDLCGFVVLDAQSRSLIATDGIQFS